MIGATDAHAKNFSALYGPTGELVLAPLYDVTSGFPCHSETRSNLKLAMGIGGETSIGKLGRGALGRFASLDSFTQVGIDEEQCRIQLCDLALAIPPALERALNEAAGETLQGVEELTFRLQSPIEKLCHDVVVRFG